MPFRCMHTLRWAAFPTLGCGVGVVSQPISVTISTAAVIRACAWGGLLQSNRCLNSSIKNSVAALCKINKPRAHSTAAVICACACPTTPRQWAETKKTKPRAEHGCRLVQSTTTGATGQKVPLPNPVRQATREKGTYV